MARCLKLDKRHALYLLMLCNWKPMIKRVQKSRLQNTNILCQIENAEAHTHTSIFARDYYAVGLA